MNPGFLAGLFTTENTENTSRIHERRILMRPWTPLAMVVTLAVPALAARDPKPAVADPYVTVSRDDAVAFQLRRDRITNLPDQVTRVWLRWLWAKPQPWQGQAETARIIVAHKGGSTWKQRSRISFERPSARR